MQPEDEWNLIRTDKVPDTSFRISAIRIALLFSSVAVALALFLVPFAENQSRNLASSGSLDMMSTGSVSRDTSYTLRRSVLQPSETSVCIIRADGTQTGEC
jgi:hypothetical protein